VQIAIQGALGSFHHEAALRLDPSAAIVPKQTFADVFEAVIHQEVAHGLCAITNTMYGPIHETQSLLKQSSVLIINTMQLQIAQQLIGPNRVSLQELANSSDVRVLSQAPALAQVRLWLGTHLPHAVIEETHDTAASVQTVVSLAQPHTLAVAGRFAASTYSGTIVAEDIQDRSNNYTSFVLFTKKG